MYNALIILSHISVGSPVAIGRTPHYDKSISQQIRLWPLWENHPEYFC